MTYNPQEFLGAVGNYPLYAKKIFLTFLQAWFSTYSRIDSRFTWTSDFKTTKLLVLDKNSYDTGRTEPRPAIIINRGPLAWANATIGQISDFDLVNVIPTYTDLIPISVSLNCLSKSGMEAEELASIVMNAITAHKMNLMAEGVHQITNLSMGQEISLRNDVGNILQVVPLTVNFLLQSEIAVKQKFYPLTVKYTATHIPETVDSTPNPYWDIPTQTWSEHSKSLVMDVTLTEDDEYSINVSGYLEFDSAPVSEYFVISGQNSVVGPNDGTYPALGSSEDLLSPGYLPKGDVTWEVYYTRADTLEATTYELSADGVTKIFELPGGIYGYTELFNAFDLTETVSDDEGWGATDD